jgi:Mannose-6-phosphate isomerase
MTASGGHFTPCIQRLISGLSNSATTAASSSPQRAPDRCERHRQVRLGERAFLLERDESTFIPIDELHRLENPGSEDIHLIEVQCGDHFGEDDIVRLEDIHGRAPKR